MRVGTLGFRLATGLTATTVWVAMRVGLLGFRLATEPTAARVVVVMPVV